MAKQTEVKRAYEKVFSTSDGQTVLEDLDTAARQRCHTPNDPYTTAFNEGQRCMAQAIIDMAEKKVPEVVK